MNETVADAATSDALISEVARLRAEIAQLEERVRMLDRLAHEDPLIELPNRRGFMRELQMLTGGGGGGEGEQAALLFVDIDGLKQINDRYGHKAGDEALAHVARLLTQGVRKRDCVARIGGDEFGVLLKHTSEASARETAGRLRSQMAECEFSCDGHSVPLGIAIGLTMIEPGDQPDAVICRADRAMYAQKPDA